MKKTVLIAFAFLCGCAHQSSNGPSQTSSSPGGNYESANPKERSLYELGIKALTKKEYQIAVDKFSALLNEFPTTRWLSGAFYNLGLSYEGLGQFAEAAEKYKKVVDFYQNVHSRDEAEALYRLSICYESLGDDTKMVLALLDLDSHSQYLPADAGQVELPARLAAAYSRLGNHEQGQKYYARAERGLKRMRRVRLTGDVLIWLPKTLYSMGHMMPLKKEASVDDFKNYISSLDQSQIWLLRAAEMGNATPWSKKSSDELVSIYKDAWTFLDTFQASKDPDLLKAEKLKQEQQRAMAAAYDLALGHVKRERLPSTSVEPENSNVSEIFKTVTMVQKFLDQTIHTRDAQDQDTVEAKKRESLKRKVKLENP